MSAERDPPSAETNTGQFSLRKLLIAVGALCVLLATITAGLGGLAVHAILLACVYQVSKSLWRSLRIALAVVFFIACFEASGRRSIDRWEPSESGIVRALAVLIEIESVILSPLDGGRFDRAFHFRGGALRPSRALVYWGTLGAIFAFSALRATPFRLSFRPLFAQDRGPIDERRIKAEQMAKLPDRPPASDT